MRFRLGLTGKFVANCLAFGLLPMSALAILLTRQSTQAVEDRTASRLQLVAQNVGDKIDRNLFERYGDVQAFGFNEVVERRDQWFQVGEEKNAITRRMNQYVDAYDFYLLTIMVDLDGKVVAVNTRDNAGKPIETNFLYEKNFRDATWFQACKAKRFTTSRPFTAKGNDQATGTFVEDLYVDEAVKRAYPGTDGRVMNFTAPVLDSAGQMIGCWTNRTTFDVVRSMLAAAHEEASAAGYPGTRLIVIDSAGSVILEHDPATQAANASAVSSTASTAALTDAGSARAAMKGESGYRFEQDSSRGNEAVGYTHLKGALGFPGMNWALVVRVPESEIVAAAGIPGMRLQLILILVEASCIIVVMGVVMGRRSARPIVQLADAATRIAVGDLDARAEHDSNDELGALARAFSEIIDSQRQLADAARRLSQGETNFTVAARGDRDVLGAAFVKLRATMKDLVREAGTVVSAAKQGALSTRGRSDSFEGAFRELVQGINETLDAVVEPVNEATAVLNRLADRDLTARVTSNYAGDHAKIKSALNAAADALGDALSEVRASAAQVAVGSNQIASGGQTLAQTASEQASALGEVAERLREMSETSHASAANAVTGRRLTGEARHATGQGVEAMVDLTTAMKRINESSAATAKIVKTIDEIAFQTNLLALNAAVEAARAGESGRGFAVVADEVRNLAKRSADAARQTADLIEGAAAHAREGQVTAEHVVGCLSEIDQRVGRVTQVMSDIDMSSQQLAGGIGQINSSITRMNEVTQRLSANSEESASAAEELLGQALAMSALADEFKLDEDAAAPAVDRRAVIPQSRSDRRDLPYRSPKLAMR